MKQLAWNNGNPVWNKGKAMKPPILAECCICKNTVILELGSHAKRNIKYRFLKYGVAYCGDICRKIGIGIKISNKMKGKKPSKATMDKAREAVKKYWSDPEKYEYHSKINLGRKHSKETLLKKSISSKNSEKAKVQRNKIHSYFKGEKSPHWKGGITPINLVIRNSIEAKQWRISVFERDNYTCQICGIKNGNGKTIVLNADHIKSFAKYPELRWELSNGRTLCRECHQKTPTWGKRKHQHI